MKDKPFEELNGVITPMMRIMIRWIAVIGLSMAAAGSAAAASYQKDEQGQLVPRMSYPRFLERTYHFVLHDLDNGWAVGNAYEDQDGKPIPTYVNYALVNSEHRPGVGDPRNADAVYAAFHHSVFIRAFLAQWRYTGNPECLARARQLADWNLARRTPANWKYGSLFYSTVHNGKVGGSVDGDAIMTDKSAIMALALLELSEATGDARYRQAAEAVAATLAKTQLPEGNWPFRVNPKTGEVREAYTSSAIYAVMLFEALGRDNNNRWANAKAKTLKWIIEGPVTNMQWNGFYEDVTADMGKKNRTNWDCIDTARWLIAHRDDNPEYLPLARRLHDWIAREFVDKNNAWVPAEGLREQKCCFATMGAHTTHWAALLADLHEATGEESFKQRALNACALVTYWMRDDGVNRVGPDWPNEIWFSCHFGTALYLYDTLNRYPELLTDEPSPSIPAGSAVGNVVHDQTVTSTTAAEDSEVQAGIQQTEANVMVEVTFTARRFHADPFKQVNLDVVFTDPAGTARTVPAFWAGGDKWKVRYASCLTGTHNYQTHCNAADDSGLHGVHGRIEIKPYTGHNPLLRHGPLRIAADHRHFEHADGTPFFWLGDTWWKGLCKRISLEGFQQLTADRKAKGFTVVQIVAGPYPDEPPFDPRWENEGGLPYQKDYRQVNPAYFDQADRRIKILIDAGIVPAIVGGWGWHMPSVGLEKMNRHWRYLIARYGAYPVVWIIGGEAQGKPWNDVARYVQKTDPYRHPATLHHPGPSGDLGRRAEIDDTVIDFDLLQTGHGDMQTEHGDWGAAANTISKVTSSYSKTPAKPVLVGEVAYEGHMMAHREDLQRFLFWSCLLSGAAGHTYGAGGIWQMNSETVRGADYEFTPWFEAMNLPGSSQLGLGKKLLEAYPWWRFEPHPEWVEPHSTTLLTPHENWYDDYKEFVAKGGKWDLPYAAGIPGEVRFIFIPGNHFYQWQAPTVTHMENNVPYHAFYFDPASGRRFDLGIVMNAEPAAQPFKGHTQPRIFEDRFEGPDAADWKDYGTPTERQEGRLVGTKGMVTIVEKVNVTDVMASADANSNAEAGIILRFHDADNYVVALYSPMFKNIFIHDRKNGQWGAPLGTVAVPEIGPEIRLTAAACGEYAALVLTDGQKTYHTPSVPVSNTQAGQVGLWLYQIGERQEFDNFEVSRTQFASTLTLPKIHGQTPLLISSGEYKTPRLPAPQDWVLVLERVKPL